MEELILKLQCAGYTVDMWNGLPDILEVFGNGFSGLLFCLKNGYAAFTEYESYPCFSSDPLDALYFAANGYSGILNS